MADYSMADEKWTKNKGKVESFLSTHDLGEMEQVIRWNLNQGDADPDNRKRYWTSITTLFGMLPNNPFHSGRKSDLPEEIILAINEIATNYAEAFSASFARPHLIGEIVNKQGKSGQRKYSHAGEYHESLNRRIKSTLTTCYQNYQNGRDSSQWDGSMVDGILNIKFGDASIMDDKPEHKGE